MKIADELNSIHEADIKITVDVDGEDFIETVKGVDIRTNKKGWKVASKDGKFYISKDGKVYMEVEKNHPALK